MAGRIEIFGIPIDNLTVEETLQKIEEFIRSGRVHQHVVVNVDKIVKAHRDAKLREVIRSCDLINVDGQPVVWMSRWLGQPLKERVNGTDLMMALIERSAEKGYRPFFLGAREEIVTKLAQTLQARYPQLSVAGWHDGYWSAEEEPAVVEQIRRSRADILFVAISSPKKEIFLGRWKGELGVPFMMGVGGSFDVAAGCVKRAPRWMQKAGLEWLYRLMQEPARMWRRYLVDDMAIVPLFWKEWWRLRSRRSRVSLSPGQN
ncbi:MAG: WecB/TagA/CpsF family glycosyltransferase [Verrucomicrobiia bacterium]